MSVRYSLALTGEMYRVAIRSTARNGETRVVTGSGPSPQDARDEAERRLDLIPAAWWVK